MGELGRREGSGRPWFLPFSVEGQLIRKTERDNFPGPIVIEKGLMVVNLKMTG